MEANDRGVGGEGSAQADAEKQKEKRARTEPFKPENFDFDSESVHIIFKVPPPIPPSPDKNHVVVSTEHVEDIKKVFPPLINSIMETTNIVRGTYRSWNCPKSFVSVPPGSEKFYARILDMEQFILYLDAIPRVPVDVWSTLRRLLVSFSNTKLVSWDNKEDYKQLAKDALTVVDKAALTSGFYPNPNDYVFRAAAYEEPSPTYRSLIAYTDDPSPTYRSLIAYNTDAPPTYRSCGAASSSSE